MIRLGVNVNAYLEPSCGFHTHATALQQAVFSGSLEAVETLIEAGADANAKDLIFGGTALGWAQYMQTEVLAEADKKRYASIENYLLSPGKMVN